MTGNDSVSDTDEDGSSGPDSPGANVTAGSHFLVELEVPYGESIERRREYSNSHPPFPRGEGTWTPSWTGVYLDETRRE